MRQYTLLVIILYALNLHIPVAEALITFEDGDIHDIDYEIDDLVIVNNSPGGETTTLNLLFGGVITGGLQGRDDSEINIIDGYLAEMLSYGNSIVNISGR